LSNYNHVSLFPLSQVHSTYTGAMEKMALLELRGNYNCVLLSLREWKNKLVLLTT